MVVICVGNFFWSAFSEPLTVIMNFVEVHCTLVFDLKSLIESLLLERFLLFISHDCASIVLLPIPCCS